MNLEYINGVIRQFEYYKNLGDKTFNQLSDNDFFGNTMIILIVSPSS